MIRRPPRSTLSSSSAASDVYKRQGRRRTKRFLSASLKYEIWLRLVRQEVTIAEAAAAEHVDRSTIMRIRTCLLYTSDAADEEDSVDLGGRRIIKKKK